MTMFCMIQRIKTFNQGMEVKLQVQPTSPSQATTSTAGTATPTTCTTAVPRCTCSSSACTCIPHIQLQLSNSLHSSHESTIAVMVHETRLTELGSTRPYFQPVRSNRVTKGLKILCAKGMSGNEPYHDFHCLLNHG
jgi:hypothetical protein